MIRVRWSSIVLVSLFVGLLALLLALRDVLLQAHLDDSILRFASDATVYYNWYDTVYAGSDVLENWTVFLRGSPILFMTLSDGNLLLIQACNLALMLVSLKVAMGCLDTLRGRTLFLALSLIFPYFAFGFLSLNKEVYAMCSAMFYGSYLIRGRGVYLFAALVLAVCARYYMVAALLMLMVAVPRNAPPRSGRIVAILLAVSLVAPISKQFIPEYSYENLLEGSGATGTMLAAAIDRFGYALVYPIKYVLLLPIRAYGYMLGGSHDMSGAIVSILSIAMVLTVSWLWIKRRHLSPLVRRLIVAGFVAPIPIMWSEIMHWRYYSFVYFFFLFAVLLNMEERKRAAQRHRPGVADAPSGDGGLPAAPPTAA